MKIDIRRSDSGDWIALYVDGKLVEEGHSISEGGVIRALGLKINSNVEYTEEQMDAIGNSFPMDLSELKEIEENDNA